MAPELIRGASTPFVHEPPLSSNRYFSGFLLVLGEISLPVFLNCCFVTVLLDCTRQHGVLADSVLSKCGPIGPLSEEAARRVADLET